MTRRVFALTNSYTQSYGNNGNSRIGICTAASLLWAKETLQRGRGLGSTEANLINAHVLNGIMFNLRKLDDNPEEQTRMMGLRRPHGDRAVHLLLNMQQWVHQSPPYICVFWNDTHTMGYRTSIPLGNRRAEFEFFDQENGLWVSDSATEILDKMKEIFTAGGYSRVQGCRVVALAS